MIRTIGLLATHNLEPLCILTPDAKMLDVLKVPTKYHGLDRYEARKLIVKDIEAAGLMIKIEDKIILTPYSSVEIVLLSI